MHFQCIDPQRALARLPARHGFVIVVRKRLGSAQGRRQPRTGMQMHQPEGRAGTEVALCHPGQSAPTERLGCSQGSLLPRPFW